VIANVIFPPAFSVTQSSRKMIWWFLIIVNIENSFAA